MIRKNAEECRVNTIGFISLIIPFNIPSSKKIFVGHKWEAEKTRRKTKAVVALAVY